MHLGNLEAHFWSLRLDFVSRMAAHTLVFGIVAIWTLSLLAWLSFDHVYSATLAPMPSAIITH